MKGFKTRPQHNLHHLFPTAASCTSGEAFSSRPKHHGVVYDVSVQFYVTYLTSRVEGAGAPECFNVSLNSYRSDSDDPLAGPFVR